MLHAVRLTGMAGAARVADRFGLDQLEVAEHLLDLEASGWISRVQREPVAWTITDAGRLEDEARLAAELDGVGAGPVVRRAHRDFLPLNARFLTACTRWQLRPLPGDPLAVNDHTDWRWDERVLAELEVLGRRMAPLGRTLADALTRFGGYPDRYAAACGRALRGERRWVDAPGIDSCHAVWFELHEDLLATLGIERGTED